MTKNKSQTWYVVKSGKLLLPWTAAVLRRIAINTFMDSHFWPNNVCNWEEAKRIGHSVVKIKIEELKQ